MIELSTSGECFPTDEGVRLNEDNFGLTSEHSAPTFVARRD